MIVSKPQSAYRGRLNGDWDVITAEVAALASVAALEAWWRAFQVERLSDYVLWQESLLDLLDDRRGELRAIAQDRALDEQFLNAVERNP